MIAFLNGRMTLSSQVAFIVILCATRMRWTLGIINTQDNKQTQQCMLMRRDKRRVLDGRNQCKQSGKNTNSVQIVNIYIF